MFAMAMAAVLQVAVATTVEESGWQAAAAPPFEPGSGASSVACLDFVYATRGGGTREFAAYNPVADEWVGLAEVPAPVTGGAALASDGTQFVFAIASSTVYRYSIASNEWADLGPTPAPTGWGCAAAYRQGSLYVLRGGNTRDFWRYDAGSGAWGILVLAPANVGYGGAIVEVPEPAACFGVIRGNNSDDQWRYRIVEDDWVETQPLPEVATSGAAMTFHGGRLYVLRGGGHREVWLVDPGTGAAERAADTPAPCFGGTSAVVIDGHLHVIFGQQQAHRKMALPRRAVAGVAMPAETPAEGSHGRNCSASGGGAIGLMPLLGLVSLAVCLMRRGS
jgi:uncharacterized protein (TIGR03382 family)